MMEDVVAPDHYAIVYTEPNRRIFVIISEAFGNFVLTKSCTGPSCGCIGCILLQARVTIGKTDLPVLDLEKPEELDDDLVAYAFSDGGEMFLLGLKHKTYKTYKGTITKARLDGLFCGP
ncbi:MAG: hypothetical protein ACI4XG_18080, partial [Bradyrhizobium sp.]